MKQSDEMPEEMFITNNWDVEETHTSAFKKPRCEGVKQTKYIRADIAEPALALLAKVQSGEIETPCGKTIQFDGEKYTFSNGETWTPSTAHRVELQIAILDNDKRKYKSAPDVNGGDDGDLC